MVSWIKDFSNTYHAATKRWACDITVSWSSCLKTYLVTQVCILCLTIKETDRLMFLLVIYTTTSWWKECTGNSAAFGSNNPLWIAHWSSSIGSLPAGWQYVIILLQYARSAWLTSCGAALLHSGNMLSLVLTPGIRTISTAMNQVWEGAYTHSACAVFNLILHTSH